MDKYVTGATIRALREQKGLTQNALAELLYVSDKAVSKWETGRGYPDITLLEALAQALGVSVLELLRGGCVENSNRAGNLMKSRIYVCPVCGNVLVASGEAVVSCCGITLPPQEAEAAEGEHALQLEPVEDEYYVTLEHEMSKEHYISFVAFLKGDGLQLVKLYPEGPAAARFKRRGHGCFYAYCNRHGLFKLRV